MKPERLWFRRKRYGWGWTPVTWEGWLVTLAAVVLITLAAWRFTPERPREFTVALIAIIIVLLIISYRKGESPRWSWGD